MEYVVYCDESRHDGADNCPFMAIGGIWVGRDVRDEVTKAIRRVRHDLKLNGELKWSKVSSKRLSDYKKIVDVFFDFPLCYRAIVVDQKKVDYVKHHGSDRELGFYKFYYEMLEKWLIDQNKYTILLDFKKNKGSDRYITLKTVLERKTIGRAWINDLTIIDSSQAPVAQLGDILTGAIAAEWCGIPADSAKAKLASYIADRAGLKTLRSASPTPDVEKINIFKIKLEEA